MTYNQTYIAKKINGTPEQAKAVENFINDYYFPDWSAASFRMIDKWIRNAQADMASGIYDN